MTATRTIRAIIKEVVKFKKRHFYFILGHYVYNFRLFTTLGDSLDE